MKKRSVSYIDKLLASGFTPGQTQDDPVHVTDVATKSILFDARSIMENGGFDDLVKREFGERTYSCVRNVSWSYITHEEAMVVHAFLYKLANKAQTMSG